MTASAQQRLFNQYPIHKPLNPDIWHRVPKEEKRSSAIALVYSFLLGGGTITKCPAKKRKGGKPEIFGKDSRAPKAHEKWNRKFYAGDDFTQKGPRFTSKPVPENSAAKRDIERKAGVSHSEFTGSVIDIGGKLQERNARHATSEAYIDLVSDNALRESAKRDGGRHSHKIVTLIEDSGDDVKDAYRSATIRDDLNLNAVDHAHNAKFKLAA
jgi:hypothetical protein